MSFCKSHANYCYLVLIANNEKKCTNLLLLFFLQANDADIELNGKLTYFFTNSGPPLPFMINPSTGEITVNDTLDRDNPLTSSFYLDVRARDHGIPSLQVGTLTSYINLRLFYCMSSLLFLKISKIIYDVKFAINQWRPVRYLMQSVSSSVCC